MNIIHGIDQFKDELLRIERPLGLVPTMGAIHSGHMALIQRARLENATVAVSIFVNPTQFGLLEDYSGYPRNLDSDISILENLEVDLVFVPTEEEMYPEGFETKVDVGQLASRLEGEFRPGHFNGVATVVCKLLVIARPDRAYFGQKDAQQSMVIRRLNFDLNLGTAIVIVPTAREPDGLAFSSRNRYLGLEERKSSTVLYKSLSIARDMWERGVSDADEIKGRMRDYIENDPIARIEYVSVADPNTLEELDVINVTALISLAVWIGTTRLIDNVVLMGSLDSSLLDVD